jgi:hypothetical protein
MLFPAAMDTRTTTTWRQRIEAAKQRRGLFVRGFLRRDIWQAGDWARCAVGEQVQLGRVSADIIEDPYMRELGLGFYRAVVLSRFLGRFAIRRAETVLNRIEDYALELDLRRAVTLPWPDPRPEAGIRTEAATPRTVARRG